jgi:hypothetical protein
LVEVTDVSILLAFEARLLCAEAVVWLLTAEVGVFGGLQNLLDGLELTYHASWQIAQHLHLVQKGVKNQLLVDFWVVQHLRNYQLVVFFQGIWVSIALLAVEDSDLLADDVEG